MIFGRKVMDTYLPSFISSMKPAWRTLASALVYFIKDLAFQNKGDLYFRMPVPQKRTGFVAGKLLIAHKQRKFIAAMFFQFFLGVVGYDLSHYVFPPFCSDQAVWLKSLYAVFQNNARFYYFLLRLSRIFLLQQDILELKSVAETRLLPNILYTYSRLPPSFI